MKEALHQHLSESITYIDWYKIMVNDDFVMEKETVEEPKDFYKIYEQLICAYKRVRGVYP